MLGLLGVIGTSMNSILVMASSIIFVMGFVIARSAIGTMSFFRMISMRTVLLGLVVIAATSRVSMLVRLMGLVRLVTITVRVWVLWYIGTIVMRVLRDLLRRVSWMRLGSIIVRVTRYALRWVSRVGLRTIVVRILRNSLRRMSGMWLRRVVVRVLRNSLRRMGWMRLGSIIVRVTRYALRWVSRVRLRAIVMRVSWDINGLANALVLRLMVISTVTVGVGVRMIRAMS